MACWTEKSAPEVRRKECADNGNRENVPLHPDTLQGKHHGKWLIGSKRRVRREKYDHESKPQQNIDNRFRTGKKRGGKL
jgi:hypothetical protein